MLMHEITEARSYFRSGKFAAFYEKVRYEADLYLGVPKDEDENELTPEAVRGWIASHRKLFSRWQVRVYRAMDLTDEQVSALQAGAELGQHWAYELIPENFGGFDIHSKCPVVFEADVAANDVYFPLTVAYNCLFPHECELFLERYATPVIRSIRRYWYNTGQFTEEEREDLIGATMGV